MEQPVRLDLLCDFYGEFLTANQRQAMSMRYDEDLSLGEIAEALGITRQGVHDTLHRAQSTLERCEERLGLAYRYLRLLELLRQAGQIAEENSFENTAETERLRALLEEMTMVWEGNNGL